MKKKLPFCLSVISLFLFSKTDAQLFKVELNQKVNSSTLIAEGRVITQKSFWNPAHTMIYTANTIQVYKTFKGQTTSSTIEIMTQGGSVGAQYVDVSDLLTLDKSQTGIFFCYENALNLQSPSTGKTLYDVYSSDQGFLRYDFTTNKAFAPFAFYNNIEDSLYSLIEQQTGESKKIIDASFSVAAMVQKKAKNSANFINGVQASITSFLPTTVNGGALNTPAKNTLTINGAGFSNTPSGSCAVNFKDGNSNNATPDYTVPYNSPYIVSWSDTKIIVKVPTRAATGNFDVILSDSTVVNSPAALTVYFSVLNFVFDFSSAGIDTVVATEPRLMNVNGKGGYDYSFSTSTAGGGKNFATDGASSTFARAVNTWIQVVGANLSNGANTTVQVIKDDGVNVVEFDNKNTGVPVMADGVLEVTYSWGSTCYISSPFTVLTSQKSGFDILVRNPGVSAGSTVTFEDGPCFPDINSNTYDLETIILHEIGHALNLAHINDSYEASPNFLNYVNPEKVMHYAILYYVDRRSPDNSAYTGALYTVTPQHDVYGSCGLYSSEMTQLSYTAISNDECPGTFPVTATQSGTVVNFDLTHATSNKLGDPAFTDVSCDNQGTFVTNNAYYAFKTSSLSNGTLSLNISNYTTTPAQLVNCSGQGVRLALYEVNSCPVGQAFPSPVTCATFLGNGALGDIGGLAANQTYLLYFDGLRNTKANFNVTLTGSALPITLSKFSGEYLKGQDILYIEIEQAINVKDIEIEKSADGQVFNSLGVLPVTTALLVGKHTYIDAQPFTGNNFYRLKVVDNDGRFEYSNVILLKNTAGRIVYLYPNPVTDHLSISLTGTPAGHYNFKVYDVSGKAILNSVYTINAVSQTVSLPFTRVAAGVYIIKITNENGETVSLQKVVKE